MEITSTNYFKIKLILLLLGIATLTLPANAQKDSLFNKFTITLTSTPADISITLTGAGAYDYGTIVSIKAETTGDCYTFKNWTDSAGVEVSKSNPLNVGVTSDTVLTANFEEKLYDLTLFADPPAGGTVSGAGQYNTSCANDSATITATPNPGYVFLLWESPEFGNPTDLSLEPITNIAIYHKEHWVAHFALIDSANNKAQYQVELNSNMSYAETLGAGVYDSGEVVQIEAILENVNCYDIAWKDLYGNTVATGNPANITVVCDTMLTANVEVRQYNLTLQSQPTSGGNVFGNGRYDCGTELEIWAEADACYEFAGWSDGVAANPRTVRLTSDSTITANFKLKEFDLTVSATLGGTVSPAGTNRRNCGEEIELTAAPTDACYKFLAWVDGEGIFVSTDNPLKVAMARDTALRATFEVLEYNLTLTSEPSNSGNVFGSGRYDCGTEIEIKAEAEECYEFTSWADGVAANPRPVRLTSDSTITANFTLKQFELTLNAEPAGGGTVAGAGVYDCNDEVTITATPANNYTFLYWKDAETGETIYTSVAQVKMDKSKNWTAYFEVMPPDMFIVRLLAEPAGSGILAGGGTHREDTTIEISATPAACFEFLEWTTTDGEFVTSELNFSHTVTQDTTFVAHFAPLYYNVELAVLPADAGNISGGGEYACGARATVGAVSSACYEFVNWTNGAGKVLSENPNYILTVASDTNLTANFRTRIYTITTSVSPVGSGSVAGGGKYNCGTEAMLEATPNTGFEFLNWTSGNRVLSSANPLTLAVTGDSAIVANFMASEEDKIFIRLQAQPAAGAAELRGGGLYNAGEMVSLRATANANYTFSKWTDTNGTELSTVNPYRIQVLQDSVIVAHFESILPNYTVFASTAPAEGGSVTGQGRYKENTEVTLEATAAACYKFKHWTTETGEIVSSENPLTFTIKRDTAFIAQFDLLRYEVEAQVNPQNSGSVSGAGTYNCGQTAVLIAKPNPGFRFINWATIDSKILQNASDTLRILVANDTTVVANFVQAEVEVFTLTLSAKPDGAGVVTGAGNYEINEIAKIEATENANYRFINWTDTAGNVVSNAMQFDWTVKSDTTFVAHFEQVDLPVPTVHFTIKMSEHKLLDPHWQNYEIPIYITADADISDIVVDELVVTLRKDIFYPRAVSSGKFSNVVTETERVITITDVEIPRLVRGAEHVLTKIVGDVMLGASDSSVLILSDNLLLPVANYLPTYALINGYITLDVCDFGEQRLVGTGTGSPTLTLKNNPVGELLELECANLSAGDYTIEIMDLAGGTAKIAEFSVAEDASEYSVEVSVKDYVNGTYFVILGTQVGRYAVKVVVKR